MSVEELMDIARLSCVNCLAYNEGSHCDMACYCDDFMDAITHALRDYLIG